MSIWARFKRVIRSIFGGAHLGDGESTSDPGAKHSGIE